MNNPNLRWETTEEYNAGIDFSLIRNRISGSVDYFLRDTRDQLFAKPLPSVVGFSSIMINSGTVRNSGVDIQLNTVNIKNKGFAWESSFNLSFLKNKVTELPSFIPQLITGGAASFVSNYHLTQVGSPMLSYYGYRVEGVFQTPEEVAASAQKNAKPGQLKFADVSGNGMLGPEDRVILGKPFPDFTGGLNNSITYKNFNLNLFVQWVKNIQTLDVNVLESFYPTNEYRNRIAKYYVNRWTGAGTTNTYPSGVNASAYGGAYAINSFTIQDASFFRLKTASLYYNIPLVSHNIIRAAQVYVAGDNLLTSTKYEGFDPDASATGTQSISKVNYNSYPLARTIRIGFNLTF